MVPLLLELRLRESARKQKGTPRSKVPSCRAFRFSILGIAIMAWSRYLIVGYLDPCVTSQESYLGCRDCRPPFVDT